MCLSLKPKLSINRDGPDLRHQRAVGFTLLEVIIVITIIAAVSGMAVLSMNLYSPGKKLNTAAERMLVVVQLLNDESIIMGQEYGLMLYRDGYRIVSWFEPEAPENTTNDEDDDELGDYQENDSIENEQAPALMSYWRPAGGRQFASEHSFPEEIELTASVEGVDLLLPTLSEQDELFENISEPNPETDSPDELRLFEQKIKELAKLQPALLFLSSGETQQFQLQLTLIDDTAKYYTIAGDIAGNIEFNRPGQPQ